MYFDELEPMDSERDVRPDGPPEDQPGERPEEPDEPPKRGHKIPFYGNSAMHSVPSRGAVRFAHPSLGLTLYLDPPGKHSIVVESLSLSF